LKAAIDLCDNDNEADVARYKNLIVIDQELAVACSYKYSTYGYKKDISLTYEAKTSRNNDIMAWQKKNKRHRS
jgi:hypothetical protein